MRVIPLEPEPKSFPSAVAYALARYSRSADSLELIQEELMGDPDAAAGRLAAIFHGYGHDSVAGMAHIGVALEEITILDSMRFFYACPYGDGQERSTRYQSKFLPWVSKDVPLVYRQAYLDVLNTLLNQYYKAIPRCEEALGATYTPGNEKERKTLHLRALDCARYLLPLGVRTSLGQVQSARAWRDYLKYLDGLEESASRTIRCELQKALEASGIGLLVRHCEAPSIEPLKVTTAPGLAHQELIADQPAAEVALVEQRLALDCVARHPMWLNRKPEVYAQVSNYLLQFGHRDYCRFANLGAIRLRGYADLGTIKDLNRHRSLEKFIPFLEPDYNLTSDLVRSQAYALPPYPEVHEICNLDSYYALVWEFFVEMGRGYVSPAEHSYHCKCLLPQAHKVAYHFYGSPADYLYTIRLRVRPGGHLSYRQEVARWAQELAKLSPLWEALAQECPVPEETVQTFFSRG
jgi:hypothetical protein